MVNPSSTDVYITTSFIGNYLADETFDLIKYPTNIVEGLNRPQCLGGGDCCKFEKNNFRCLEGEGDCDDDNDCEGKEKKVSWMKKYAHYSS